MNMMRKMEKIPKNFKNKNLLFYIKLYNFRGFNQRSKFAHLSAKPEPNPHFEVFQCTAEFTYSPKHTSLPTVKRRCRVTYACENSLENQRGV